MKTFKNAMGWGVWAILFIIVIAISSCGKGSGGAGGTTPIEPPQATKKPDFTEVSLASKVYYGETATGVVRTVNTNTVTANPGIISGTSLSVGNVIGYTVVTIVASDLNGNKKETTAVTDCWSQKLSFLCKNSTWHGKTITIGGGAPTPWTNYHFTFGVNGKYVFNGSYNGGIDAPPADYLFNEATMKLAFGGTEWSVQTLSETDLVLTRINEDNKLVITTYQH